MRVSTCAPPHASLRHALVLPTVRRPAPVLESRPVWIAIASNRGRASGVPSGPDSLGGGTWGHAPRKGPFRAHARRSVRLRALVTHVQAGWQRYASVENVGLGGARLLVEERLATGDAVTLSFTAPTLWDPLVLRAHVAWHGQGDLPNRVGLAFEHRSPEAVFALYELIVTLGYE
jgi:hypothetical protein